MYTTTIYSTPDQWGNQTVYADETAIQTVIAGLIDAGGDDWAEISLGDCSEWALVQVVGGFGLYQEQRVRNDNYIALRANTEWPGEYLQVRFVGVFGSRLATYDNLADALEELNA